MIQDQVDFPLAQVLENFTFKGAAHMDPYGEVFILEDYLMQELIVLQ